MSGVAGRLSASSACPTGAACPTIAADRGGVRRVGRVMGLGAIAWVLLSATGTASTEEASWPGWRGPERDGKSAFTGLRTDWNTNPPKLLWQTEGCGGGYASVSIADDLIFTTGNFPDGQSVVAKSLQGGKTVWRTPLTDGQPKHGYEGSRSTPTIDGDRLYVVSSDGAIHCLALKDGKRVWSRKFSEFGPGIAPSWGFAESPLIDGDRVICSPGGPRALLVALNKANGKDIWKSASPGGDAKGQGYSSIMISNGGGVKQYVQLAGPGLVGVRADNGRVLWSYDKVVNRTANIPTPIVDGDYVFASTGYGTGAVLLKLSSRGQGVVADEQYFLDSKTFQNHHGGMILLDGYIYAGHQHNQGFPICLEMKTGKIVWGGEKRGPGTGSAAVTYVDGHLVFRYQNGVVALIKATPKAETDSPKSWFPLVGQFTPAYQERESWSHPVIVDGVMYLREQDRLMAYDVR